jgi:electron transport complex protein RnfE
MSKLQNFLKGIIKENPVLVLVLGTCPTLATTSSILNALGMGVAATMVLLCSNMAISALRNIIPDKVRIPCYIVLIAGFVTAVELLMHAFVPTLYSSLGIFLSLIVVNCIILGRAEMYASKNGVLDSALDALGMGGGFIVALGAMAFIREVFGAGSFCGITIPFLVDYRLPILTQAPGGFFVFGILIALVNKLSKGKAIKKKDFGCKGCPAAANCGRAACDEPTDNKGVEA